MSTLLTLMRQRHALRRQGHSRDHWPKSMRSWTAHVFLADCSENGGLSFAYAPGILEPRDATGTGDTNSGTARTATTAASGALTAPIQAMQYTKVEILLRTVEVSALTVGQDPETLIDCIIRCYCAAVPLLKLRAGHPRCLVFRALVTLHQALWLVPLGSWDETVREMFSASSPALQAVRGASGPLINAFRIHADLVSGHACRRRVC